MSPMPPANLLEHLGARHLWHPLIGCDQRHRPVAKGQFGHHGEGFDTGRRPDDPVVGAVPGAQGPG
ncbi:MAG: hypothetical protein ACR2LG_04960 [Actinomycetota bacterium]